MNASIDISRIQLRTPRLLLRPWEQRDLQDFFAYASVEGVGPMAGFKPHDSLDVSQSILDHFIREKRTFAIEHEGRVVGSLGIEAYDEDKHPELDALRCRSVGFVLAKSLWGKGLMPEAVQEVIRYLFEQKKLDAILCAHFLWNAQSARVQQKCGFRPYKTGQTTTSMGTVEQEQVNILTRQAWLSSQG